MEAAVLAGIGLICLGAALWLVAEVRRQIREMTEILEEIQKGNGNRRILASPGQLTAPLAYAVNGVVQRYEEEQLRARRSEAADRQLMTSLSHDVRTPLTTLIGYLDAVHRQVVVGEEAQQYLEIARRKAYDLKGITDGLFAWCKLHSGEADLQPTRQDLGELTRNILVDWVPLLEEARIDYEVNIPETPFWALADGEGYRRILNNLLQNVLAHSHATRVTLEMGRTSHGVQLRLGDNGVGIAPEELGRIFDRLYRCDPARTAGGSGLGLSIAQGLAKMMGGCITADSSPGQGTVFSVVLPGGDPEKTQEKAKVAARSLQGGGGILSEKEAAGI